MFRTMRCATKHSTTEHYVNLLPRRSCLSEPNTTPHPYSKAYVSNSPCTCWRAQVRASACAVEAACAPSCACMRVSVRARVCTCPQDLIQIPYPNRKYYKHIGNSNSTIWHFKVNFQTVVVESSVSHTRSLCF